MTRYRQGRRNGHAIYRQHGDQPSDGDRFVGSCVTAYAAAALVERANRYLYGRCDHGRLSDAVRAEGYGLVVDPEPWLRTDARGDPDPSHTAVLCADDTIAATGDSWDHAYAVAHEIAEDRRGHTHSPDVFCEQANLLAKWCRALAGPTEDGGA